MDSLDGRFLPLFLAHQPQLHAYLLARGVPASDVDDVVQETAAVLWRKFADYQEGTNFRAWAFAIAKYEWLKRCEREKKHARAQALDESVLAVVEQQLLEDERDYSQLHGCIARLGGKAQQIIDLYYREGLSFDEMSERMGVSSGSLRTRLSRVRKALAECLTQQTVGGSYG